MNHCRSPFLTLFLSLPLALAAAVPAYAGTLPMPSAQVDWQVGVIALVCIGLAGAGATLAASARLRRETRATEAFSRKDAARAQSAITGDNTTDDLHDMALDIEEMVAGAPDANNPYRTRTARRRHAPEGARDRDQNTPGNNLQRTRWQ